MMKKASVIILSAIIALIMCSCGAAETIERIQGEMFKNARFEDDTNYTVVNAPESVDSSEYTSNGEIIFGYDALVTDSQRKCYNLIKDAIYRISETPDENGFYPVGRVCIEDKTFTDIDMDVSIKAFTLDHPQVFWITNRYTYGSAGNQSIIQLYSYLSGSECPKYIEELNNAVNEIMTATPGGMKPYHLEKHIHNAVIEKCTYAKGIEEAEDGWEEFTSYGALVKGSAVCEGYAHAMCLLLNKVGIPCYYVNGYSEEAPHMWNTVKVGDNWYHLDATWDDDENAYYNFFNVNDEQIKTDHDIDILFTDVKKGDPLPTAYNIYLPECTSNDANYFVIESTYIDDFEESRDVMVSDLINSAENGDSMFTIRFGEDLEYNNAIDEMFNNEPYYMFRYIKEANDSLPDDHKISDEHLAIIMIETFNAVVVRLEY